MRRDVFQAIADPTRRDIILLIGHNSLNLNAIAETFPVSRQAISNHIKILTECGIVVISQQGRERYCFIQPKKLEEVHDWLADFKKIWEDRFDRLDNLLEDLKTKTNTSSNKK